jgi:sugar lactone lactonase YvrE
VSVTVFSAAGEPVGTLGLPRRFQFARVAFNGRTACVVSGDSVVLFDAADGRARVFTIPEAIGRGEWWFPYSSPDGAEVWLLDTKGMRLVRYALPVE